MRSALCITLAASMLFLNQQALSADGDAGGAVTYPRTMTGAEVRKLYGERPVIIEYSTSRGNIRWEVFPDGRLFGHNDSLIGTAAVGAGTSSGKWNIDEGTGAVCHEWDNRRWTNSCSPVVETEPGAYAWAKRGGSGGLKFTIKPQ